ncbi:MAG: hypothetical protein L6R28_05605 [Planctomycetes bacterium]|nr:hypothetical protein [Planctomycetota bacterium]
MDLLIHAIIWLFKALFGDSEEQARVGPRRDSESDSGGYRRGPYDYGDGRSSGSGGTKTLAELLEEARRQSGAAPSRPAAPQQPAPPPPAQVRNVPQGTRSLADLLDEARRQGRAPQAPAQQPVHRTPVEPAPIAPPRPAVPVAPAAPAYQVPPPPQPQPSKKKKRKRRDEARPAQAPAAPAQALPTGMHGMRTMQGAEGMRGMHGMRGMLSAKTHRGVRVSAEGREVGRFVAELRSASGDEKRMAGAHAVAMLEVFGAPRSKRPHRPGARLL